METKDNFKVPKWSFAALGLALVCLMICWGCKRRSAEDWPTDRIERITGVRLPEFSVIKYVYGHADFFGEYKDTLYIEFESIPSDTLFEKIEGLFETNTNNSQWTKDGGLYQFHGSWGTFGNDDPLPAPEGEDPEQDRLFYLTLIKGERIGIIVCGMW